MKRAHREKGSALIDLIIGLSLFVIMGYILLLIANQVSRRLLASDEAQMLTSGRVAIERYIDKNGAKLLATGEITGFPLPYEPTQDLLVQYGYLSASVPKRTKFDGQLRFYVFRNLSNGLTGIVCDSAQITEKNKPSTQLATLIASSVPGGVTSSEKAPSTLNGAAYSNITSPLSGSATVCTVYHRA